VVLIAAAVALPAAEAPAPAPEPPSSSSSSAVSTASLPRDLPEGWYVRIETRLGRIVARLAPEQAPQGVAHFAGLAMGTLPWTDPVTGERQSGHYYDGVPIHRAEAGFRFEAGDRAGTGVAPPRIHVPLERGPLSFRLPSAIGLTRDAGGKVSGVQFFVTASAHPWLDSAHPLIGVVVEGRETVFQISQVRTYENGRPVEPVVLDEVRVFAVGDPPPLPEPVPYTPQPERLRLRPDALR